MLYIFLLLNHSVFDKRQLKFQFDQESGRRRTTLWMCYLQIIIIIIFIIKEIKSNTSAFETVTGLSTLISPLPLRALTMACQY